MHTTCAICLDSLQKKKRKCYEIAECGHAFHVSCIRNWFASSVTCPVCRSFAGIATRTAFLSIPGKACKQLEWLNYSCAKKQLTVCGKFVKARKRRVDKNDIKRIFCDKNTINFVVRGDPTTIKAVYKNEEEARQNFKSLVRTFTI